LLKDILEGAAAERKTSKILYKQITCLH